MLIYQIYKIVEQFAYALSSRAKTSFISDKLENFARRLIRKFVEIRMYVFLKFIYYLFFYSRSEWITWPPKKVIFAYFTLITTSRVPIFYTYYANNTRLEYIFETYVSGCRLGLCRVRRPSTVRVDFLANRGSNDCSSVWTT